MIIPFDICRWCFRVKDWFFVGGPRWGGYGRRLKHVLTRMCNCCSWGFQGGGCGYIRCDHSSREACSFGKSPLERGSEMWAYQWRFLGSRCGYCDMGLWCCVRASYSLVEWLWELPLWNLISLQNKRTTWMKIHNAKLLRKHTLYGASIHLKNSINRVDLLRAKNGLTNILFVKSFILVSISPQKCCFEEPKFNSEITYYRHPTILWIIHLLQ